MGRQLRIVRDLGPQLVRANDRDLLLQFFEPLLPRCDAPVDLRYCFVEVALLLLRVSEAVLLVRE